MAVELLNYDSADHFTAETDQAELLQDALDSKDPGYIAHALGIVARARGMSEVARQIPMKRTALYRALSNGGNPTLATLVRVLDVLGLEMKIAPKVQAEPAQA